MELMERFFRILATLHIPRIGLTDILEILIITFVIYQLLVVVRNTRTWFLVRGLVVLLVFFGLAEILELNTILFIAEHALSIIAIGLVVVFQQELRKALEQLGSKSRVLFELFGIHDIKSKHFDEEAIEELVKACFELGRTRTGALIVIEKEIPLDEYVRTGIHLDALISSQLLINIFEHNTPLHDGAIIIKDNRIVSATCYLPLSKNMEIPKELGTRHRAAIGVSENTDSLTVIVSEETGNVSCAEGGLLTSKLTPETLREVLRTLCEPEENTRTILPFLKVLMGKEDKNR